MIPGITRAFFIVLLVSCAPAANAQLVIQHPVACTTEAMRCSDGSYVSRTGPNCQFSRCPDAPAAPSAGTAPSTSGTKTSTGTICNMNPLRCPDGTLIYPGASCSFAPCIGVFIGTPPAPPVGEENGGLSNGPDEPLDAIPDTPQSVKFVVEHRTALNRKRMTVQGIVVSGTGSGQVCEPGEPCYTRMTIADSNGDDRDMNYDVPVAIGSGDNNAYITGQPVTLTGIVFATKDSVAMRKE